MNLLDNILPKGYTKRKWLSILLTAIVAGLLTIWGIYGIGRYGIALFVLTPIFIGVGSTILFGYQREITKGQAWSISLLTLSVFTLGLLICAIEGLICILMAAPIGLFLTWIGSLIGYALIAKKPNAAPTVMIMLMALIPLVGFVEKDNHPDLRNVVSSVEINADAETVWKNVVAFPRLKEPQEFIFKTGIAYPIDASIEGQGVGAIRHCNFTTGSFVEPISVWNEPRLLKFDVLQQPAPMKELSFWDINSPHLHDYFVSKCGQFKLTALPNGHTLLEGTTWYYNNISPDFYWRIWSDYIIHKIHNRVLLHIKLNSERRNS